VEIARLQEQIASGRRFSRIEDDPLNAVQVVRTNSSLASLAQYQESSRFGIDVLGAQDQALGEAVNLVIRAEEIATQQATGLFSDDERAAALEEVRGLLQGLTTLGNSDLAGRRLFAGLALDAPAPFADPTAPGYDPTTAYTGSAQDFSVKIGAGPTERIRVSTQGDAVFEDALVGVVALENALATNGDVSTTFAGLSTGRATITAERASVGARQTQLTDRDHQASALRIRDLTTLSRAQDADAVEVVSQLLLLQTALQTTLAAGAQLAQTSLANLIAI